MSKLSPYMRKLIKEAYNQTNSLDRYMLCERVCLILEDKYPSEKNLEYQLRRMNIATTREILAAVDIFLYEFECQQQKEEKIKKLELFERLGRY